MRPGNTDDLDGLREFEAALTQALRTDAERITPTDRLAEIQAATAYEVPTRRRGPRLLTLVAAAAAAAVIGSVAAGQWLTPGDGGRPGATVSSTAPTTPGTPSDPTRVAGALPVYYLGPQGEPSDGSSELAPLVLYRTFVTNPTPGSGADARVVAAVSSALRQGIWYAADVPDPWRSTTVLAATVSDSGITLTLSNGGSTASGPGSGIVTERHLRMCVQQLVWTAQAAAGRPVPVTFALADGASQLFGRYPTSATYDRPHARAIADEIAPVWIDSPGLDAAYGVGRPVTMTGLALIPIDQLTWKLTTRAGDPVASGSVEAGQNASSGLQHGYRATIPRLAAGTYRLLVSAPGPAGGVVGAQTDFTVR